MFRGENLLQSASRIAREYGLSFGRLYLNGVFPVIFPNRADVAICLNVSCIPAVSGNRNPTSSGKSVATTSTSISLSALASPLAIEPKKQIETKRLPKNSLAARTYSSASVRYSCCNQAHPSSLWMALVSINPTRRGICACSVLSKTESNAV